MTIQEVEEGKNCWDAFVKVCVDGDSKHTVAQAEEMIKVMGHEIAFDFILPYFKDAGLPENVIEVFKKAYKYYGWKLQNDSTKN